MMKCEPDISFRSFLLLGLTTTPGISSSYCWNESMLTYLWPLWLLLSNSFTTTRDGKTDSESCRSKTISWHWNQWRTSHFRLSAVSCYLPVSDLFHLFLLFCFLCVTVSRCCPKAPFLHLTEVWAFFNHIVWRCLSTDRQSKLSCLIDAGLSGSSEAAAPKASCPLPQEAAIGKNIEGKTMLCQRLFTAGREKHKPGEHGTWLPVATANVTDVLWCLTIIDFLFYDADDCEI